MLLFLALDTLSFVGGWLLSVVLGVGRLGCWLLSADSPLLNRCGLTERKPEQAEGASVAVTVAVDGCLEATWRATATDTMARANRRPQTLTQPLNSSVG